MRTRRVACGFAWIALAAVTAAAAAATAGSRDTLTFHGDPQRSGWRPAERELTHAAVAGPGFGPLWDSPAFDAVDGYPPRLYASPLYVEAVSIAAAPYAKRSLSVVYAATSNGFVYAVNAFEVPGVPAGAILWRRSLGVPCKLEPTPLDGVLTGVLSTPVIDRKRGRLYVAGCDPVKRWQAFALDLASGEVLAGWPVPLDEAALNAPGMNANASDLSRGAPASNASSGAVGAQRAPKFDYRVQRGALNLSPDGTLLYVTFGETATGWLVAVDAVRARLYRAFASVAEPHHGTGGIWGPGGPAVDADGHVFVATGTTFSGHRDQPHDWTQSVLKLSPSDGTLALRGTYTPFNHCETANMDIDLGSGGIALLPGLSDSGTRTPRLLAIGGKQGNVYLLDRARLPGRLDRRAPCSSDASSDASLLAPEPQPQFAGRGTLNVFGPYSERDAALDLARGRSVPAYFRGPDRRSYLFVTGNTKIAPGSPESVPPSLARLRVIARAGEPAYLQIDQLERSLLFENPGSAVVTSNGSRDPIVWVLDENARRTAVLRGDDAPRPVLYALSALDFKLLWRSGADELRTSGKYNEPAFARGTVFVGTDRIQAFGVRSRGADRPAGGGASAAPGPLATDADDTVVTAPAAVEGVATMSVDGRVIYQERCAACHDHPQGRIPPRALLANRQPDYVVSVLTDGAMREHGRGLTPVQIRAVASYLVQPEDAR